MLDVSASLPRGGSMHHHRSLHGAAPTVDVSAIVMSPLFAPSPSPPRVPTASAAVPPNILDVVARLRSMDEALRANALDVSVSRSDRVEPSAIVNASTFSKAVPTSPPPLPAEIAVLEREVSRLMRYVELQRDRWETEREEYTQETDDRARRLVDGMRQECDDLVEIFTRKADEANFRAHVAEAECARLSEMPSLLQEARDELAQRRAQYEDAERGWIGLMKERQVAWAEEKDRLEAELHAAKEDTLAAKHEAAESLRAARQVEDHWRSREAAEQMRIASLRDSWTQTQEVITTEATSAPSCPRCADANAALTVERDRYARVADVATRLQIALKQTTEAAQEWQDRATQLEKAANANAGAAAAEVSAQVEQVRHHYERVVLPDMQARHRAELDVVVGELDAAHRQITSLLKKNRALAESVAATSDGGAVPR